MQTSLATFPFFPPLTEGAVEAPADTAVASDVPFSLDLPSVAAPDVPPQAKDAPTAPAVPALWVVTLPAPPPAPAVPVVADGPATGLTEPGRAAQASVDPADAEPGPAIRLANAPAARMESASAPDDRPMIDTVPPGREGPTRTGFPTPPSAIAGPSIPPVPRSPGEAVALQTSDDPTSVPVAEPPSQPSEKAPRVPDLPSTTTVRQPADIGPRVATGSAPAADPPEPDVPAGQALPERSATGAPAFAERPQGPGPARLASLPLSGGPLDSAMPGATVAVPVVPDRPAPMLSANTAAAKGPATPQADPLRPSQAVVPAPAPAAPGTDRPAGPTAGFWERFFTGNPDLPVNPDADAPAPSATPVPAVLSLTTAPPGPVFAPWPGDRVPVAGAPEMRASPTRPTQVPFDYPRPLIRPPKLVSLPTPPVDEARSRDEALFATSFPAPPGTSQPAGPASPAANPPVPQIAAQITAALTQGPSGITELALSPEELGHVRLRLEPDSANPDRMLVMITVERPETLDLFRRHAGDLAEALRQAGYAGADIGFGRQGSGNGNEGQASDTAPALPALTDETAPQTVTARAIAGAALDLRL